MTDPARLRAQAEDLRDAARTLRAKAPALDDDTHGVLTHYPHTSDGVWWGQAADEFYALVQGARTSLRELAGFAPDAYPESVLRSIDEELARCADQP